MHIPWSTGHLKLFFFLLAMETAGCFRQGLIQGQPRPGDTGSCDGYGDTDATIKCGNNIIDVGETCETCPQDCGICATTYGAEFYVSTTGLDSNAGTKTAPFATLERARAEMRSLKNSSGLPEKGVVVWLRGGTYVRSNTFELTGEDSGAEGRPVVYRSYPPEKARLVGGKAIPGNAFTLVTASDGVWPKLDAAAQGNVYVVHLPSQGITDFGTLKVRGFGAPAISALELFFNSEPMTLARWPDRGSQEAPGHDGGFVDIAAAISGNQFDYFGDRPSRWTSASELWLHGYWYHWWAEQHVKVAAIDTNNRRITLAQNPGYGIKTGQHYYAYNLLEEITVPGEWYLDRSIGNLYFWPPADLEQANIMVSLLETTLVNVSAASHIVFEDLALEIARKDLFRTDHNTQHILLRNCQIKNSGSDGIYLDGSNNGLDHCEVSNTGDKGVYLMGGQRSSLTKGNNYVTNSNLHHFGRWGWTYMQGVSIEGCGNVVAHNWFHDAPHSAIQFTGNEHLIEYNKINNVCEFASDAGAIYSGRDWGYRGNLVQYNFVHDIDSPFSGYGEHGVYLDDCVSGIKVFGNIFYRVSGHAIQHGGGRDVIMENNIMVKCGDAFTTDNRGIDRINNIPGDSWNLRERLFRDGVQYQQDPWASAYPACAAIPNDWEQISATGSLWRHPQGSIFSRNIGYLNTRFIIGDANTVISVFKESKDNIENQDPLFEDEANLDLRLKPNSPAFTIPGFINIPFEKIGIQP